MQEHLMDTAFSRAPFWVWGAVLVLGVVLVPLAALFCTPGDPPLPAGDPPLPAGEPPLGPPDLALALAPGAPPLAPGEPPLGPPDLSLAPGDPPLGPPDLSLAPGDPPVRGPPTAALPKTAQYTSMRSDHCRQCTNKSNCSPLYST